MNRQLIIGVDFDGTIVEHRYPNIGPPCPGAIKVLREVSDLGAKIILWTMRSGSTLDEAVGYIQQNSIPIWGINKNPQQVAWTQSPKAYCNVYIDDAALGCPLIKPEDRRPFVDWKQVRIHLLQMIKEYTKE